MADTTKEMKVSINLSDVDCIEPFPDRIFTLGPPNLAISVGRGSQSDETIEPGPDNAWFSSRVMSRHHATLEADPLDLVLTIRDDGSMHGTFLNGSRVGKEPLQLIPGDIVTFGTEVVRGEDTYQPLKVAVHYDWEEREVDLRRDTPSRNKFTVDVPDDDVDTDTEDEVQVISASMKEPSVEVLYTNNRLEPQSSTLSDAHPQTMNTTVSSVLIEIPDVGPPTSSKSNFTEISEHDSDLESEEASVHEYSDEENSEKELDDAWGEDYSDDEVDEEDNERAANESVLPVLPQTSASNKLGVQTDAIQREPSPSDAALARSKQPTTTAPPLQSSNISSPLRASIPNIPNLDPVYGTSPMQKFPYDQPSYQSGNSLDSAKPSHSFVNSYYYPPDSLYMSYNPYSVNTGNSYPWNAWKNTNSGYYESQVARPPTRSGTSASTTQPALGINNDQNDLNRLLNTPFDEARSKKRKLDEFSEESDDESVKMSGSASFQSKSSLTAPSSSSPATAVSQGPSEVDKTLQPTYITIKDTVVSNHDKVDIVHQGSGVVGYTETDIDETLEQALDEPPFSVQAAATDEPPKKKLRTDDGKSVVGGSRMSTALRYTATALAGATIGALGTVVGLASLPADFFA